MVFATAVRMSTGGRHEHITHIKWLNCDDGKAGEMTTQKTVEWIRQGGSLWVAGANGKVEVRVVDANPPYLRTVANNTYTDNLLQLPRF